MVRVLSPMEDAYGQELWAHYNGKRSFEIVERDYGYFDVSLGPELYFSNYEWWSEMEKKAKLRPLINRYELLSKRIKTLKTWINGDGYDYELKDSVRLMEKDKRDVARKIIEILSNDAVYREACRMLGVKDSVEPAILTVELPLHLPITRLKGLLGYTLDKNKGRYNHKLNGHITALAVNLYLNAKKHVNVLDKAVEIVDHLPKEKAIYKLELMTLKALRKTYLLTINNQIFDNPTGR